MSLDNDDLNIKEWANCYLNKTVKLVSPHVDRLASNAEKNNPLHFFKFYLDSIEIDLKQTDVKFNYLFSLNFTVDYNLFS